MLLIQRRNAAVKTAAILLVLLAAFFPAKYVNSIYGYLPGLGLLSLLLLSVLYLMIIRRGIRFETEAYDTVCQRGDTVNAVLKIVNRSVLICPKARACLSVSDSFGEGLTSRKTFVMYGKSETEFPLTIKMEHIGVYSAGLNLLEIYDPLGIFSITIRRSKNFQITVLPKTFPVEAIRFDDKQLTDHQNAGKSAVSDGFDYTGVREYALGDSMKRIHWKLSAHSSAYMTKITESSRKSDLTVIIDFRTTSFEREMLRNLYDALVETALSLIEQAAGKDVEHSLLFMGRDGEINKVIPNRKQDYQNLVQQLPAMNAGTDPNFLDGAELLEKERHLSNRSANLILITSRVTEQLVQELTAVRQQQRNPELYYIVPYNKSSSLTGCPGGWPEILNDYDSRYHFLSAESVLRH